MTGKLKTAVMAIAFLAGSVGVAAAQDYRYHDRDDYYGYNRYDRGDYGYDRGDFFLFHAAVRPGNRATAKSRRIGSELCLGV